MKSFRLAVLWDWPPTLSQVSTWQDGLAAALKELRDRGHEVQVFMPAKDDDRIMDSPLHEIIVSSEPELAIAYFEPDVILHWADFTRPHAVSTSTLNKPMAICFSGGNPHGENMPLFDHIFVESQVYAHALENHPSVSIAFGTNTDLFAPVPKQPKTIDSLMIGTFALWKRHELFARASAGLRAAAYGYMYDTHEKECWQVCLDNGVAVFPHTSPEVLRYVYAASRVCVIPSRSDGGSQRSVLEAMAMNIPVIVTDSDKFDYEHLYRAEPTVESIRGYLDALLDGEQTVNTREYILENWSHHTYADQLETGLCALL